MDWEELGRLLEATLPKDVEDTPANRRLVDYVRWLSKLVKKHKNLKHAFEELYGLSGMEITPPLQPTDFPAASFFYASAREQIRQITEDFNTSLPLLVTLLPKLNPYKTPGYSLGIAVDRARQLSRNRAKAGGLIDNNHINFAPYVDVLVVDKRTFTFLKQEFRDRPEFLVALPEGRVRRAGSIHQLEEALGL